MAIDWLARETFNLKAEGSSPSSGDTCVSFFFFFVLALTFDPRVYNFAQELTAS